MKRSSSLFFAVLAITMCFAAGPVQAALELFTGDYYVANANQWLGKEITLSVAYFSPPKRELSVEKMEVMDAYTFHNHVDGGHINVAAPPEIFARLKATCGIHVVKKGGWVQSTQIHGKLMQKDGQYYVQVDK